MVLRSAVELLSLKQGNEPRVVAERYRKHRVTGLIGRETRRLVERDPPNSLDQKPALSLTADSLGEYTTQEPLAVKVTQALPGVAGRAWCRSRSRRSGASARRR